MREPELRDIFQWEVRTWSRALRLWEQHLPVERPFEVLGIGEREGGLSLWLATKGGLVTCTDLGALPPATHELHVRYGVTDRISYAQADATALPFADGSFDVVVFKSVIGALGTKERQLTATREMHRVLRPGGSAVVRGELEGHIAAYLVAQAIRCVDLILAISGCSNRRGPFCTLRAIGIRHDRTVVELGSHRRPTRPVGPTGCIPCAARSAVDANGLVWCCCEGDR